MDEAKDVILYGRGYWQAKITSQPEDLTTTQKLHLIYSLMTFLSISLATFLEFYFTSAITEVRQRAGMFMSYRPSGKTESSRFAPAGIYSLWHKNFPSARPHLNWIMEGYAKEVALEESNRIIRDPSLQIQTGRLTIHEIRELLRPTAIMQKFRAHAPFMWGLMEVFSSSPNRYRNRKKNNLDLEDNNDESEMDEVTVPLGDDVDGDVPIPEIPAGFSRNPIYAILVAMSMLAFVRNRATNLLPLLLGLFFKVNGTSSRVIQMLSNIGLSVAESTIERLKETISRDAIHEAVSQILSGKIFYIIFDNINIYLRKFQQRLTNLNSMIHATNAAVIVLEGDELNGDAALDLSEFLKLRGGRSSAKFEDIMPSNDDDKHLEQAFAGLVARLIIQYCPGAEKWKDRSAMLASADESIPKDRPLPITKTAAYPFGVFDVNEGSKHGIVRVLEKIRDRTTVPIPEWVSKLRIFCGDWLTSANFRAARRDRSDDVNPMERLEYGFPLSTLWHYALQATHMIMRTHYGHSAVEDPTCLRAHKDLLNRTWDVTKPNYAASKALIRHSLIARILYIVIVSRHLKTWNGLRVWRPTSNEVQDVAKSLVRDFATTRAAELAKKQNDDWKAHFIYFIRDALLFCEFEDAVSHADAGRVLRVLRYWCFAFRGAGQHNYARECAEVLLQWKYETTPELRCILERAWFINRWGKPGRWIPSDLYVEQLNFWIKRVLIAHGNGVTMEYIQKKGSACIEAFCEITTRVAQFFGDADRKRRSNEVGFSKDMEAMIDVMLARNIIGKVNSPRIVYAPLKPRKNQKTPASRTSAVLDVQVLGGAVWQPGKFQEFIRTTAYDSALQSYPLTGGSDSRVEGSMLPESETPFDDDDNPLSYDTFEDLYGSTGGANPLGGGDEYWTGNPDDA